MTVLAVLLGSCIFILLELNKVYNKEDFSWSIFIKRNIFGLGVTIIFTLCCILFKESIIKMFPTTKVYFNSFVYFILAIGGPSPLKRILDSCNTKVDTFLGKNKKI